MMKQQIENDNLIHILEKMNSHGIELSQFRAESTTKEANLC